MDFKNVNKLFGVLVLGGAMMSSAHAQDTSEGQRENGHESEEICQIELSHVDYRIGPQPQVETVCLDGKSDEEVLSKVNEFRDDSCMTPFCGCWLG